MTVDIVVADFSELQYSGSGPNNVPDVGDGGLAWCKNDEILAIQYEQGGDWLPYLQAGAIYNSPVILSPASLAAGASADVTVALPPGKFTQSPRIIGITGSTTRYNYSVKSVTKDQVVIRVQNVTTVASTDVSPSFRFTALQTFV